MYYTWLYTMLWCQLQCTVSVPCLCLTFQEVQRSCEPHINWKTQHHSEKYCFTDAELLLIMIPYNSMKSCSEKIKQMCVWCFTLKPNNWVGDKWLINNRHFGLHWFKSCLLWLKAFSLRKWGSSASVKQITRLWCLLQLWKYLLPYFCHTAFLLTRPTPISGA